MSLTQPVSEPNFCSDISKIFFLISFLVFLKSLWTPAWTPILHPLEYVPQSKVETYLKRTVYPIDEINNPPELIKFDTMKTYFLYEYMLKVMGDFGRSVKNICQDIKMLRPDPEYMKEQEAYRVCMDSKFHFDGNNCLVYSFGYE